MQEKKKIIEDSFQKGIILIFVCYFVGIPTKTNMKKRYLFLRNFSSTMLVILEYLFFFTSVGF